MPPKRKTRFHGLYYHSTPPRVLPMRSQDPKRKSSDDFSIRLSTIRIWMHEKDIGKLTRVLWAGQGNRLRQQASTNPKVKRFLAAVPYVMNSIKDVHQSVVDNSLENLQATMESDVPPELITCKDANGLNVIHKAGGLAHTMMLEYLLSIWPDGAHEIDMTGKTPLHWAATAKDNMRCYTMLTEAGCDEEALDYKMKTPIYYKTRLSEIERSFLTQVPDAPRVSQDIPIDWEALASDESDDRKKQEINITKGRRSTDLLGNTVNLLTPRSEANSLENTSEPDLDQGDNTKDESTDVEVDAKTLANGYMTTSELETDHGSPQRTPEKHQMGDKNGSPKKEVEKLTREENVGNALSDEKIKEDNRVSEVDDNETKYADDDVNIVELQIDDEDVQKEIKINEEKEEKEKEHQTDEKLAEDLGTKIEDAHPIKTDNEHFVNEEKKEIDTENDNEKTDVTDIIQEMSKIHYDEILREQLLSEEKKTKKYVGSESYVFSPSEQKIQMEGIQKPPYLDEQNSLENVSLSSEEYILTQNLGKISSEDLGARNLLKESPPLRLGSARSFHTREIVDKSDEVKIKDNHNKNAGKKEEKLKKQEEEDDDDDDQDVQIERIETPQAHQQQEKYDVNANDPEHENEMISTDSPTSSLAIEGFVSGDSEDNQVQSESAAGLEEEERYIEAIINSGDMEQLAAIVLNGDGKKIMNRKSSKPEIQAFLTNVPAYMDKISRVHEAAKQGTLYQLQAALDRRKFAIAKDENSPCGASPLHVAVLFGHTDIVRYLAGRFPETTSAVDDDGRTPLHYAATINDNGHFFNLLSHLGGNPKATDKLGNTAEFYMNDEQAKNVLSYRQLLQRFGAEAIEDEMLNDQAQITTNMKDPNKNTKIPTQPSVPDDLHSSRRNMLDMDVATTLERCFSVIQESTKCLSSATASAIATQRKPRSASSQPLTVTSYLGKFLRRSVFDKIKKRQTRLDHNLFDVIWPAMRKKIRERRFDEDLDFGIIAPDYDVYVVFQEFLVPLIKDIHCLNISSDFKPHPRIIYFPVSKGKLMDHLPFVLNDDSKLIVQCSIECSRNLEGLELPLNLNVAQIEQAERTMMGKIFTTNFAKAIGDRETGSYYTMNEVLEDNSVILKMLHDAGLLISNLEVKDRAQEAECLAFNGHLWPYGRGVFVNAEQNLALWLNCQEHLRIISSTSRLDAANIGSAYSKVGRAVCYLETQLHFKESYLLGYLAARPHFLGTGLKMITTIQLPNLIKEIDNLRHLCSVRGLLMMSSNLKNCVRLVNMQSLGATELLIFREYCTAVANIISLEKDMSLTNSKHIASMLVKIFRRKRDSLVDRT